jgi:hypothetical protein
VDGRQKVIRNKTMAATEKSSGQRNKTMKRTNYFIVWTYLLYVLFYETLVIGGCGYVVFGLGHSGWWFLLAVLFSCGTYSPERWHGLLTGKETQ